MITIQYLMSEHFSDSISNRSAQPEENTAQKKYLTRLLDHNNIDLLCDKESSLTDLPEFWSHKELLHNIYKLINHGNHIIPVTHKEVYPSFKTIKSNGTMENPLHAERSPPSFRTIKTPTSDYSIATQ